MKQVRRLSMILALLIALATLLSACGKTPDSSDGRPPLEKKLKELYSGAQECYDLFFRQSPAASGSEIKINGVGGYYLCIDERFPSLSAVQEYALQYFTPEYVAEYFLNKRTPAFAESRGQLYVRLVNYQNVFYAGHVFELISRTEEEIQLKATIYSSLDVEGPGTPFYTTPERTDRYTTRVGMYTLTMTDDGWRFSRFASLYT